MESQPQNTEFRNNSDFVCLVCGFTSQSTAMVMSRQSVNLTTLFLGKLRLRG